MLGEWHDTNARIVDDRRLIDDVYDAYRQKYGWQIILFNAGARIVGRYDKRIFIEVDF